MDVPLKSPDELLPQRTVGERLAARPTHVHSAAPDDPVVSALRTMADNDVGIVVVLDGGRLVGVMSERDYARKVILLGRTSAGTRVADIMTREVVTASPGDSFRDCMALMDRHHVRHLPVVDGGRVTGVISAHDVLAEMIAHHEKLIMELERERMTMLTSTS